MIKWKDTHDKKKAISPETVISSETIIGDIKITIYHYLYDSPKWHMNASIKTIYSETLSVINLITLNFLSLDEAKKEALDLVVEKLTTLIGKMQNVVDKIKKLDKD